MNIHSTQGGSLLATLSRPLSSRNLGQAGRGTNDYQKKQPFSYGFWGNGGIALDEDQDVWQLRKPPPPTSRPILQCQELGPGFAYYFLLFDIVCLIILYSGCCCGHCSSSKKKEERERACILLQGIGVDGAVRYAILLYDSEEDDDVLLFQS